MMPFHSHNMTTVIHPLSVAPVSHTGDGVRREGDHAFFNAVPRSF